MSVVFEERETREQNEDTSLAVETSSDGDSGFLSPEARRIIEACRHHDQELGLAPKPIEIRKSW